MEQALGAAFGGVRIHTDSASDEISQAIGARAFTTGPDIFFRRGAYSPSNVEGKKVLAHELTHVIQQGGGSPGSTPADTVSHIQRVATPDLAAANQNINYVTGTAAPGLTNSLQALHNHLNGELANYQAAHHGNDPPANHRLDWAAGGLYRFTERMIEQLDGGWNEVGEAERLATKMFNPIRYPILGIPGQQPDIYYRKAGAWTGVEAKAVNSANAGQVTAVIQIADNQLGNYGLARSKILIWIAHPQNLWPGVWGFHARNNDGALAAAVQAQLNGMPIGNADVITIIDVNTNYGVGGKKDVQAVNAGPNNWNVNVL